MPLMGKLVFAQAHYIRVWTCRVLPLGSGRTQVAKREDPRIRDGAFSPCDGNELALGPIARVLIEGSISGHKLGRASGSNPIGQSYANLAPRATWLPYGNGMSGIASRMIDDGTTSNAASRAAKLSVSTAS